MKIQLPFGRTVDTDVEPPEETEEVKKAREEQAKHTKEAGKYGSLTQVLLGIGAMVTAKELVPQEKLDAAAQILEKVKMIADGYREMLSLDAYWKGVSPLRDNSFLLACLSNALDEAKAHGLAEDQELITQILLPDLRDEIHKQIRYIIDPSAKVRDEEQEKLESEEGADEAESEAEGEQKCHDHEDEEDEVSNKPPMNTDEGTGCEHCEGQPDSSPFIYAVDPIDPEMGCRSITINSVSYWKKHKCLADHYSDKEHAILDPILENLGMAELMESTYEVPEDTDIESIKRGLHAAGIFEDPEFTKWLDGHREGDR